MKRFDITARMENQGFLDESYMVPVVVETESNTGKWVNADESKKELRMYANLIKDMHDHMENFGPYPRNIKERLVKFGLIE